MVCGVVGLDRGMRCVVCVVCCVLCVECCGCVVVGLWDCASSRVVM